MWNAVLNLLAAGFNACFSWFDTLMKAIPGAWDTIFTLIVIFILCRFLLGPVLGVAFSGSSDKAKIKQMQHENKLKEKAKG